MTLKGLFAHLQTVPTSQAEDGFFSPLFLFDRSLGQRPLAGLDEAGRGPLAGPLVAAAVILPDDFDHPGINDSKKLSADEREKAFDIITSKAVQWAYTVISPAEVDILNPLVASMQAMSASLSKLSIKPKLALADGNKCPLVDCPCQSVIKGDSKSLSIASASIVAKVIRDRLMIEEHARYPLYGFDRHKGYGTKAHLSALSNYGPSPIHRLSYRGVLPKDQGKVANPKSGPTLF
ncbi:MAG: ribonuclease HII [Deltaproteobacteria bacterium]|jgi:ribonuclease HII|nr:ribonuclease HII [Deltaproteobacteria bacterium]